VSEIEGQSRAETRQPDPQTGGEVRRFPDLFEKALQGSTTTDHVTVVYDGEERRKAPRPPNDVVAEQMGGVIDSITPGARTPVPAGAASMLGTTGVSFGAPAHAPSRRRWRKGR
jgi:hypothetical protein